MRHTLLVVFSFFIVALASLALPIPTLASGTTTSSSNSGQVVVKDENGVIYLTTQTNGGTSTVSARRRLLGTPLTIPTGFAKDVAQWINAVLSLVIVISGLLVLMYLVWGAFDWLTSGGDKGKIDSARNKMMAAVVGIIIVSASYAILLLVISFLGFSSIDDVFESVVTIDNRQAFDVRPGTPSPTPSPSPSATPTYSDNLGELMAR